MDERSELAQALWDATRAQHWEDFMPTVMTDMGSCLHVADLLLAAGYRRTQPSGPSFCPPLPPGEDETCTHTPTCPTQPSGQEQDAPRPDVR